MNNRQLLGYRGTRKKYTDMIVSCDDWRTSDGWKYSDGEDEYFGHGIYFFEEDYSGAFAFAKDQRGYEEKEISIIKVLICCERRYVLDFFIGELYKEYVKELTKTLAGLFKNCKNIPQPETPFDCGIINYICKKQGYQLVRGPAKSDFREYYETAQEFIASNITRIQPTHIELCVKDINIIKDFMICCA